MNQLNSFVVINALPKFVCWTIFEWEACTEILRAASLLLYLLGKDMEVLTSIPVYTKAFSAEVDAGFGFVIKGDVLFCSNFKLKMSKGALNIAHLTL